MPFGQLRFANAASYALVASLGIVLKLQNRAEAIGNVDGVAVFRYFSVSLGVTNSLPVTVMPSTRLAMPAPATKNNLYTTHSLLLICFTFYCWR